MSERADLDLPAGSSHVCNISGADLTHYAARNELTWRVFTRKEYMRQFYDTSVLLLGEPQATADYTTTELIERGIVGIYGKRWNP
jgi:hypothetical protein